MKETLSSNEKIELARQSGYNEACYVMDKRFRGFIQKLKYMLCEDCGRIPTADIIDKVSKLAGEEPIAQDNLTKKEVKEVMKYIEEVEDTQKGFLRDEKGKFKLVNGRRISSDGYIEIYSPYHPNKTKNKTVTEHRLVMENNIKRFLTLKEVVHHINGDKQDNRIENLELLESKGKHTVEHNPSRDSSGKFNNIRKEGCGKYFKYQNRTKLIICGNKLKGQVVLCPACLGDKK